jgi:hypothetical protein
MKTYSVDVRWDHKGTKYPKEDHTRVKCTSMAIAANMGIRKIKEANRTSWREPVGSSIRVSVTLIDNGKEAE